VVADSEARYFGARLEEHSLVPGADARILGPTHEVDRDKAEQVTRTWNQRGGAPIRVRGRQELVSFFDGLELLEPGVVSASQWRPDPANRDPIVAVATYCAVGRKP
jgi:S-adenosyl methyltransferase